MDNQTATFLHTLFDGADDGELIEVRTRRATATDKDIFVPSFHESIDDALAAIERANKRKQDVFVGVAPRTKPDSTKKAVAHVMALWADIDSVDAPPAFALPPTMTVSSGHGYHLYWKLDAPENPQTAEAVMKRLDKSIGADALWDRARIMRVPGTLNYKNPSEPVACALTMYAPDATWNIADLSAATTVNGHTLEAIYATELPSQFPSRSERDWSVVCNLIRAGVSDDGVARVFDIAPIGDKAHEDGGHYLAQTIQKAHVALDSGDVPTGDGPQFVVRGAETFVVNKKFEARVATFTFAPEALIEHSDERAQDSILGTLTTPDGVWQGVVLSKKAFDRVSLLNAAIPQASALWLGTDKQAREYLAHLNAQLRAKGMPVVSATSVLGRHGDYFVGSTQTLTTEAITEGDARPIRYVSSGREGVTTHYTPAPAPDNLSATARKIFTNLFAINRRDVIWPAVGWLFATPYKSKLLETGVRFPHLDIYGTRGSGKSATIRALLRLIGVSDARSYDASTTPFVTLSLLGSANAVPVSFTEYRESQKIERYLLIAYDSGRDARGHADQSTTEYPLLAPIILDGEDAIASPAIRERVIMLRTMPETVRVGTPAEKAFRTLDTLPLEVLAAPYIQRTLYDAPMWAAARDATMAAYEGRTLPERVLNNLTVVVMGMMHLSKFALDIDAPLESDFFNPKWLLARTRHPAYQVVQESGRTVLLADEFIEAVINCAALTKPQDRLPFLCDYAMATHTLEFNLSSAYSWWLQARKREQRATLGLSAIRAQLEERLMGDTPLLGQYVVKMTGTCVVHLPAAHAAQLDVPESIDASQVGIFDIEESIPEKEK